MKIVIIGGVAGGATAAARLRRRDESAEIIIFERSGYISYANCGLPYYIGGIIEDKNDLTLQTPESFARRFRIDARILHEVTDIDVERKCVTVKDLQTGAIFEESYDKLILSPGAKPIVPAYAEKENDVVFTLRTVEDTFRIHSYIEKTAPKTAVIIGGGFIGLEMAENLHRRSIRVTLIQRSRQLLNILDPDMASFLHAKCRKEGIRILFDTNVTDIQDHTVYTDKTPPIEADMIVAAIGVSPENTLAKKAGLALGAKGAIAVNDRMQTSAPDVYAVGDAVEITHFVTKEKAVITLAGPANKEARIAADNITGRDSRYKGSLGSSVIKMFDMTFAQTGLNEKAAKAAGIDYEKVVLTPSSHAGYYPAATAMTMKILYEKKTLRLLGAQIAGYDGVDKRIDVLATAIFSGLPADALQDLDLAYAPPYSSAKDPVNMAGFVIDNIESGMMKQFHYEDIEALRARDDVTLLDTRTPAEYQRGHAEGFIHIPVDNLRERLHELDTKKPVYVMCQSGLRSYIATRILAQNGFDAYNFSGGYRFYQSILSDAEAAKYTYPCGIEK